MPHSVTPRSRAGGSRQRPGAATAAPPRIAIERVRPVVDGGRYPVKRLLGDEVVVFATVYKEGHDRIGARLRYRGPGDRAWHTASMTYVVELDECRGAFRPDRIGLWTFTVEAWTDRFESWCHDLDKKVVAQQSLDVDLLEGAALVAAAAGRARGSARKTLSEAAERLGQAAEPALARARLALDPTLAALVTQALAPEDLTRHPVTFPVLVDRERAGFAAWYEMFPRSQGDRPGRHGTFADAGRRLTRLAELGFDVVYLPPIHPIGEVNRKGANNALTAGPNDPGSPWAIGSRAGGHTAVDPRLGTLADFDRFVAKASDLGLDVALDYALQCAPDHPWVREHPEWFFVRPDGSIKHAENPPKKYEDIVPLNFWCDSYPALWSACRDVLEFWIARGITTFRVDNPHTKPFAFWEWLIGAVKAKHPEVVFLSEAFTRPDRMRGLAKLGFSQSYTYFTWRNTAAELRDYFTELTQTDMVEYFRPNLFTNTPDILHAYLQDGGRPAFRVRLTLAATLSPLYGIYSGFELCENTPLRPGSEEYLHSEKYEIRVRDWDAPGNLTDEIARLNRLRRENPALRRFGNLTFHPSEDDHVLFYHKHAPGNDLLIVVNVDPHRARETMVHVPVSALGVAADAPLPVEDLLTGARYTWRGVRNYVRLDPAEHVAHVLRLVRPEGTP